eukprot:3677894-Rhodomonas_salina.1
MGRAAVAGRRGTGWRRARAGGKGPGQAAPCELNAVRPACREGVSGKRGRASLEGLVAARRNVSEAQVHAELYDPH